MTVIIDNKTHRLPDFIIVGAMKAGTTTLRYILNQHKDIFMPKREILFFDIDDVQQNFDFFVGASTKWMIFDYEKYFNSYLIWYSKFFKKAQKDQIIGEDSTTYMASDKAPKRIAQLLPDVKLIFLLREPVARTYSQYWHQLNSGHAVYNFEKTIQCNPGTLLQRSFYKIHIEKYKELFPPKNMKFIIFEEFISNMKSTTDEILGFLGLSQSIELTSIETHKNPAHIPNHIGLKIISNRILRTKRILSRKFCSHLPELPSDSSCKSFSLIDWILKNINPSRTVPYPPMRAETKLFLQKLFLKENRGLSELINKQIEEQWPYFSQDGTHS